MSRTRIPLEPALLNRLLASRPADPNPDSFAATKKGGAGRWALGAVAVCVLVLAAYLRVFADEVISRSPDEGVYHYYSKVLGRNGLAGARDIVKTFNESQYLWDYPTPIRYGYTIPVALAMCFLGDRDARSGVFVSKVASIASLFLLALIALQCFGLKSGLISLVFMSCSPMELAIARRFWQDGFFALISSGLLYCALRILDGSGTRGAWLFGYCALGAYLILVKESGILFYALSALVLGGFLLTAFRKSDLRRLIVGFVLSAAFAFAVMIWLTGGLPALLQVLRNNAAAGNTNQYMADYQSGSWENFALSFWYLSPWTSLFFIAGCVSVFALPLFRKTIVRQASLCGYLLLVALVFMVIASLPANYKNLRLVSALYSPFYLFAGAGGYALWVWLSRMLRGISAKTTAVLMLVLFSSIAFYDYKNYLNIYVKIESNDLVLPLIKKYSMYFFKTGDSDREKQFKTELLGTIPPGKSLISTYSLIPPSLFEGKDVESFHKFYLGFRQEIAADEVLPTLTGYFVLPSTISYMLVDMEDLDSFHESLSVTRAMGDAELAEWRVVDYAQEVVLLKREGGGERTLIRAALEGESPDLVLDATLGNEFGLEGVSMEIDPKRPHFIGIQFYWRPLIDGPRRYQLLLTLVDPRGKTVLIQPHTIGYRLWSTESMVNGKVSVENYRWILPSDLPREELEFRIGAMDRNGGEQVRFESQDPQRIDKDGRLKVETFVPRKISASS